MSDIVARKRAFANLPIMQAMATVKCGFELETQAVDGASYDELCGASEPEFDEAGWDEYVSNCVAAVWDDNYINNTLIQLLRGYVYSMAGCRFSRTEDIGRTLLAWAELYRLYSPDAPKSEWYESGHNFQQWLADSSQSKRMSVKDMIDAIPEEHRPEPREIADWQNDVHDYINANAPRDDFYHVGGDGDGELDLDCPSGVEAKADGSVQGPEFVVAGSGTRAPQFSRMLRELFNRFSLKVDTGCSFHIHLSVPGIEHSYGALLQARMMEYLLQNIGRLPDGVRERWEKDTGYFKPRVQRDKYSFVHFHDNLRTWEFRCFGNVKNHRDGMICLKLAVEALQFAYKVSLGEARSMISDVSQWNESIYHDVIESGEHFPKAMKTRRMELRAAEQAAA